MISLTNIWKDRSISLRTKKQLLQTLVFPIATYGGEYFVLKKADEKLITDFELWCYRRLLRESWIDRRTNELVLQRIGESKRVLNSRTKRKLRFLGTVARSDRLSKDILSGKVPGRRNRGRPKRRLAENVKESAGISMAKLCGMAQNRDNWRTFVKHSATVGLS